MKGWLYLTGLFLFGVDPELKFFNSYSFCYFLLDNRPVFFVKGCTNHAFATHEI